MNLVLFVVTDRLPDTPLSIRWAQDATRAEMEDEYWIVGQRGMPNTVSGMTESTTSFSNSGETIISRKIDVLPDVSTSSLSEDEFAEYYDVERTVDEIVKGGYKCVRPVLFWNSREWLISVVQGCTPVPR
jgi:hypothetical protein